MVFEFRGGKGIEDMNIGRLVQKICRMKAMGVIGDVGLREKGTVGWDFIGGIHCEDNIDDNSILRGGDQ